MDSTTIAPERAGTAGSRGPAGVGDLGKEVRDSALLLGLALVVLGLVAALASTALLLG